MDSMALNFYPDANTDIGGCLYGGCTDSYRPNYDSGANVDNGMCKALYHGCTNPNASNYNAAFNVDDGSCNIPGCMQTNPVATFNVPCLCAGTCSPTQQVPAGRRRASVDDQCWDPSATNYNSEATSDVGCVYVVPGCTDSQAVNYLSIANQDDGGCSYPVSGCTVEIGMLNYDSIATVLSGCIALSLIHI